MPNKFINTDDRPTRYSRGGHAATHPVPTVVEVSVASLTKSIITILRLIGINVITFPNPEVGHVILGYDLYYGIIVKDSTGYISSVILE